MCDGVNPQTGKGQSFYFLDDHPTIPGWFKGMEEIIKEHGLWPEDGLPAECPGFKCLAGKTTAAADIIFSISLTLFLRSQHFKKLLRVATTSVTFTPNITVNSISLSSTGVLQNLNFVQLEAVQQLKRWNRR